MELITRLKGVKRMLMRLRYRATGRPLPEFWRALLMVPNEWNSQWSVRNRYPSWVVQPTPLEHAHQILDCWLDVALDEQWLGKDRMKGVERTIERQSFDG